MVEYNRMHIDGALCGGLERWSVGLAFSTIGGGAVNGPTTLTTWCDAVMTLFASGVSWAGTVVGSLGGGSTVERVRAYHYPGIAAPADAAGASTLPSKLGSGTNYHPPQCAIVVSLNTGIPGRRTRGRVYWPAVNHTNSVNGKWTGNPAPSTFTPAFAAMIGAIRDAATSEPALEPVVVSQAGSLVTTVTSITVDDVIDTQRRRRDTLIGTKVTSAIPV